MCRLKRLYLLLILRVIALMIGLHSIKATAESATETACKLVGVMYYTNQELFSRFNSTKSCSIIPENGKVAYFYPVAVERLQLLSWEFLTRLKAGKITRSTPQVLNQLADLKEAYSAFIERGTGNRAYNQLYLQQATSNIQRIEDYLGQSSRTSGNAQPTGRP